MITRNHDEGFEKAAKLRAVWAVISEKHKSLYLMRDFMEVAQLLNPELCEGAFDRVPCRRKLRYIGEQHCYFVPGEIYHSTEFNSGTYTIEGYLNANGTNIMGCGYFEWLKD